MRFVVMILYLYGKSWGHICWPVIENQLLQQQVEVYQAIVYSKRIFACYLQTKLIWVTTTKFLAVRQSIKYFEHYYDYAFPIILHSFCVNGRYNSLMKNVAIEKKL